MLIVSPVWFLASGAISMNTLVVDLPFRILDSPENPAFRQSAARQVIQSSIPTAVCVPRVMNAAELECA